MSVGQQIELKGKTRFYQVRKLPLILQPNAFYFVENDVDDAWEGWLTNSLGKKRPIGNVALIQSIISGTPFDPNEVTDYRSEFVSPYIYSGFLLEGVPIIKRYENDDEFAQGVVDLETSWFIKETLTYI